MNVNNKNQKKTFYDEAYWNLREFLLYSDIYPGQKIPHVELGNKLGISLTPLREAFFRLAAEGLLCHQKNKGFFAPEITFQEAKELYEIRELIEPFNIEKVAKTITTKQLKSFQRVLDEYERMSSQPYSRRRLMTDREFHMLILELGNNSKLFQVVDQIYDQLIIRRTLGSLSPERPYRAFEEHREIFQALGEKNPKKAGRRMRDHIRNAENCVLSDLENRERDYQSTLVPLRSSETTRA